MYRRYVLLLRIRVAKMSGHVNVNGVQGLKNCVLRAQLRPRGACSSPAVPFSSSKRKFMLRLLHHPLPR